MYLMANVTDKQTGEKLIIEHFGYTSKRKMITDLRSNGYIVHRVSNRRDLEAMEYSINGRQFEGLKYMKSYLKLLDKSNSGSKYKGYWQEDINKINKWITEIEKIEL